MTDRCNIVSLRGGISRNCLIWLCLTAVLLLTPGGAAAAGEQREDLPDPDRTGSKPFESLLQERHSVRAFQDQTLSREQLGQILWATAGITFTDRFAHRTTPSAGALFPLELFVVAAEGLARYDAAEHQLVWIRFDDLRADLRKASLNQRPISEAPLTIVIVSVAERTTGKYGERGARYVDIEVGCACQNLQLEATALGLGSVPIGAFQDDQVTELLSLPEGWAPLLIMPVGHPQ